MKRSKHYTKIETNFLLANLGEIPCPVLIRRFQIYFSCRKDMPIRTTNSLKKKIYTLKGKHKIPTLIEDYFSIRELAKVLGVDQESIICWVRKGLSLKEVAKRIYIKRADIKKFALANSFLFRSLDSHILFWLLGDMSQVKQIKNTY